MRRFIIQLSQKLRWAFAKVHPSWHVYAAISGVIAGIALCFACNTFWFHTNLWLGAALLLLAFALFTRWRSSILLAFLAGIILANCRIAPEFSSRAYFAQLAGQEITLSGQIAEDPDTSEGKTTLRLTRLQLLPSSAEAEAPASPPVLRGTLYVQLSGRSPDFERSDIVTLSGRLNSGFGTFVGVMYRPTVVSFSRAEHGDIFARIKQRFSALARENIASPEVDLGLGYLMGMKNGLSKDFADTLRLVGMTHVVVASGAHLGIIVNLTKKLFGKISRFAELIFALLMVLVFVLIVGFTPSMTRAALVTSLSLCAGFVGRRFTPIRLLLFVAALTLLYDPSFLLNLGWQLSFASFFGLLVLLPRLQKMLYGGKNPPWLASMLLTSLATSLMCAPILAYNYGIISLLSFVANLIILPTLPYAMLLVFLTGATGFLPFIARLCGQLATYLLDLHIFIVNYLSDKTMFILNLPTGDPRIFLLYILILLYLALPTLRRQFQRCLTIRPTHAPR